MDIEYCCFSNSKILLYSIVQICNQRCKHCMRTAGYGDKKYIDFGPSLETFYKYNEIMKFDKVILSGGEPTLANNLTDLIKILAQTGTRVSLCTNATLLDLELATDLKDSGISSVTVGIEGTKSLYESFRCLPDSYKRMVDGLKNLFACNIPITINICVNKELLMQINNFIDDLRELPFFNITVTSPIIQGRMKNNQNLVVGIDRTEIYTFVNRLKSEFKCDISLHIPRCNMASCPSGNRIFALDSKGNFTNCPDIGSVNTLDFSYS